MRHTSLCLVAASLTVLASPGAARAQDPPPLIPLQSDSLCNQCKGYLLPGKVVAEAATRYAISSDLPELFRTEGVLYATTAVLPPFDTLNDGPVPEEMRTQVNKGFKAIDDSFEVFLYHLTQPSAGEAPRRVVVYTRNDAKEAVTLSVKSIIETDGAMASADGPETRLARRVLEDKWDAPVDSVTLAPGKGAVIAWSPVLAAEAGGEGRTRSPFVTGIVRAFPTAAAGSRPALTVYTLGVSESPVEELTARAEKLLANGARSGESSIDLRSLPSGCQLRRVAGVSRNFTWKSDEAIIDIARMPDNKAFFQMALPAVQSIGCESSRQTQDMLLYPPTVRPETIGNYMAETRLTLKLANIAESRQRVDLRFGKQDADIGLAWQIIVGDEIVDDEILRAQPVQTAWAGPGREDDLPDDTRSMLSGGKIEVAVGGGHAYVNLRCMVIGSSSLPYQLHLEAQPVEEVPESDSK